jgi:hypothetical protein
MTPLLGIPNASSPGPLEGIVSGGIGECVAESSAGGGQRSDPTGGIAQQGPDHPRAAFGTVIAQADVCLEQLDGVAMDVTGCDDILRWSHGPLPDKLGGTSHYQVGPCDCPFTMLVRQPNRKLLRVLV